jgi:predicted TIM-barrel fold metal-dependent hydrolase
MENVLLETSPYDSLLFIPDLNLKKGYEILGEDKLVFGSDFSLFNDEFYPPPQPHETATISWYHSCLERIEKSIGFNKKIMRKNSEIFFDY